MALLLVFGLSGSAYAQPLALDVLRADVAPDDMTGQPVLKIRLSPEGQAVFSEFTTQHVGQAVDLLVDGQVVTSPVVSTPIYSEWIIVTGGFTTSELEALAETVNRGIGAVTLRVAKVKQAP
ncbi:SecDF P1 head subdomain-containing protein [Devosia sp. Root685]|uniref:SecDF P1 head subdomain-containing protein n=1 Tax=Devosia sp. Root685 TaxID=1736587 RepID=UPI001AEC5F39|nr:hypothetical protein [Devosia sp. Root685]